MPGGVAKNVKKKNKQTNPAVNSSHHLAHLSLPVILVQLPTQEQHLISR